MAHYIAADPTYSRAKVLAIHRRAHEDDAARIEAHKIAPFNDRRPRQVAVIQRQRPVRDPQRVQPDTETMITDAEREHLSAP